ncbi:MAG: FtsH protease activity modulator HflK [Magnetovibrio sp.]|nr:FtsH protease activity modulator HflK [Magnetovibrio sp.]|tara:strand:+ start:119 stop:1234 length:1116 start_codon:yes stop_codon:yes gene_type:complete
MPWKAQGGGPWGGGGGGNGGGPWGGGNNPFRGGGRGPQPPDIEEMLRKSQDKVKKFVPGGGGVKGIITLVVLAVLVWGFSGIYRVNPGEQGVELLFGEFVKRTGPGLHFWAPSPIGDVIKPNVERTNSINIGYRGVNDMDRGGSRDVPQESLMLTSDQNIIDIDFVVQWRIKNAADYLFNIRDPQATIKIAAESAMREVIGQTPLEEAITTKRQSVQQDSKELLQKILDQYGAGVAIAEIQLQKADPPQEVIDAFQDVQRAQQDQERSVNEATAYKNDIIPRAKGEAQKMLQDAEAYKQRVIKEAEGEAKRFLSVYSTYLGAKDVTTRRLFLERMQDVLQKSEKVIVDKGQGGSGVVPYLPLPELKKRATQ